jgi:hypothetical protein
LLATLDGLAYPLGALGFLAGGIACYWLAPRRLRLLSLPLWLLIGVSSAGWTPLATAVSGWVGVDHGLQTRVRDTIGRFLLPKAQLLRPIDTGVAVGRWTPQGSRFGLLLTQLGVAQVPETRLPDYASAREAIVRTAHARLAGMDAGERSALLDTLSDMPSLRRGGDSWLADVVIVPGLCAWRGDAVLPPQARRHYAPILDALECDASVPR